MKRFHAMPAVAQLRRLQNALEEHAPGVPATLKDVHEALQRLCAANTERYRQLDAAAVNGTLKATPLVGGSSPTSDGTAHMMHRLYVACLQVGMKAHSDVYYRNDAFARIAGVSLAEMNRLEEAVVHGLNWPHARPLLHKC
jgi:hypothetical protein